MKSIDIYLKDLKPEKQQEIFEFVDSPDLHLNSYLFSVATGTREDLNAEVMEAMIEQDEQTNLH